MHPYGMKKSLWPYELQGHPIQIHYSTANIRVPPINCGFPTSSGYQWIMDDQKGSKQPAFISCRQSQFSGPFGPIVSRVNSQLQCTWLGPFLTLRWSSKCWPVELLLNMLYSNVYIYLYKLPLEMQRKLVGPLRGLFWQTALAFGVKSAKNSL